MLLQMYNPLPTSIVTFTVIVLFKVSISSILSRTSKGVKSVDIVPFSNNTLHVILNVPVSDVPTTQENDTSCGRMAESIGTGTGGSKMNSGISEGICECMCYSVVLCVDNNAILLVTKIMTWNGSLSRLETSFDL